MALTAGRKVQYRPGLVRSFPVKAGAQIWQGGLVMLIAGVAAAAAPGANSGVAATEVIVGVAEHSVLGGASDGLVRVTVRTGEYLMNNSASGDLIALSNVGSAAYVVDDETVALTSNTNVRPKAGTIVDVESDGVWVRVGV